MVYLLNPGGGVEKFSTFVFFSVLYHFKNTTVPPLSFEYFFHQIRLCSFEKINVLFSIYSNSKSKN